MVPINSLDLFSCCLGSELVEASSPFPLQALHTPRGLMGFSALSVGSQSPRESCQVSWTELSEGETPQRRRKTLYIQQWSRMQLGATINHGPSTKQAVEVTVVTQNQVFTKQREPKTVRDPPIPQKTGFCKHPAMKPAPPTQTTPWDGSRPQKLPLERCHPGKGYFWEAPMTKGLGE